MIIDKDLLDKVSEQAKASPRLRMNYNFHQSHTIEAMEPDSCIFECKEGPFVEHEVDGILELPKKEVSKSTLGVL